MTYLTQIKFFHGTRNLDDIQKEVNEWLDDAHVKGYTIEAISFQDDPRSDEYQNASTVVLVRYSVEMI